MGLKPIQDAWKQNPEMRAYWAQIHEAWHNRTQLAPETEDLVTCDVCGGIGYVRFELPKDHPQFGKLQRCPNPQCPTVHANRQARYERLTSKSQIPAMYRDLTFAAWDKLAHNGAKMQGKWDALGAALAFVDAREKQYMFTLADAAQRVNLTVEGGVGQARRNSIVFSGPNGVGKTSLAVSIAQELIGLGVPTVYVRLAEFFDAIKERFTKKKDYELGGDAEDEAELLRLYQEAPVLVIDEFAAQVTDWRRERAEQLVNYRYTHQMPTIITTNIESAEFPEIWGLILGHRVQAMAHWIVMGGDELRPRRAARTSR